MIRRVIQIDEDKCNGCGACANACHEGAIGMVNGKAKLLRDDYCDGLGDCLPACPTGAITFVEREAAAYDEAAVIANRQAKQVSENTNGEAVFGASHRDRNSEGSSGKNPVHSGCPGSMARSIFRRPASALEDIALSEADKTGTSGDYGKATGGGASQHVFDNPAGQTGGDRDCERPSRLSQWPVQIKLAPVNAPYFDGAKLLIAADCTAYAYASFHEKFIKGHVTLIGCPKLDSVDYSEKLTEIIRRNDIQSVTIVRMEVPCCGGLEMATKKALQGSGKFIPWQVATISIDGRILD